MPGWDTEDRRQAPPPPEPAAPDGGPRESNPRDSTGEGTGDGSMDDPWEGPSPGEVHAARHRAALAWFEAVPPYCIRAEPDGTHSLRRKHFEFRGQPDPRLATRWTVLSRHPDLEAAERRLRHVCGPRLYYDERGRLTRPPPERD